MTHMDDQVAKHIKEMILKIKRKPTLPTIRSGLPSLNRSSGSLVFSGALLTIPMA
jgi:hypothetical protein